MLTINFLLVIFFFCENVAVQIQVKLGLSYFFIVPTCPMKGIKVLKHDTKLKNLTHSTKPEELKRRLQ